MDSESMQASIFDVFRRRNAIDEFEEVFSNSQSIHMLRNVTEAICPVFPSARHFVPRPVSQIEVAAMKWNLVLGWKAKIAVLPATRNMRYCQGLGLRIWTAPLTKQAVAVITNPHSGMLRRSMFHMWAVRPLTMCSHHCGWLN